MKDRISSQVFLKHKPLISSSLVRNFSTRNCIIFTIIVVLTSAGGCQGMINSQNTGVGAPMSIGTPSFQSRTGSEAQVISHSAATSSIKLYLIPEGSET